MATLNNIVFSQLHAGSFVVPPRVTVAARQVTTGVISGTVTENGTPAPSTRVIAIQVDANGPAQVAATEFARTDGTFELIVPPGTYFLIFNPSSTAADPKSYGPIIVE